MITVGEAEARIKMVEREFPEIIEEKNWLHLALCIVRGDYLEYKISQKHSTK